MATTTIPQTRAPQLNRFQLFGVGAAVVGLALLGLGFVLDIQQFAESYIFGFYFAMALPLGCLGFLMLQHLIPSTWGVTTRRMLEAGAAAIPIFFLLSLPVVLIAYNALNLEHFIYEWADPSVVTPGAENFDPIIAHKVPWMSPVWFAGRMVIYFAVWSLLAILLRSWSRQQDKGGDPVAIAGRMRSLSGVGVALFVLTVTFFALDVGMSLDPHWYSTIYGVHYMVNAGLTTIAFLIIAIAQVRRTDVFEEYVPVKPIRDVGKLLFGFTIIWTYISFGQFVIIWAGDVAEFVPWYIKRMEGGWLWVVLILMFGAFFGPFFALLGRKPKGNLNYLVGVASWVLLLRFVDMVWVILPEFHSSVGQISWINLAAPLGFVGLWLAIWAWNMQQAPLLPFNDPNMEALDAGGHH
ncbi:MAG: hypothetical protein AB4911_17445 [Oscillochloridaceae bacterium umkhey_bin13]